MLAKALTLVKSKAAVAVLGVLLVGGSGGAVAVAANQGQLNGLGLQMAGSHGQSSDQAGDNSGAKNRGHAEGMLTACDAGAGTIGVTDAQGTVTTFTVNSDTKFVGYIHGNNSGGATSASNPTFALTDLCAMLNKVKVQVQADASTSGSTTTYTATKVTVEGPGTSSAGGDSSDNGDSSDGGKPTDVPTPNGHSSSGGSGSGSDSGSSSGD
ncbi:MAG TPA: hypothetical protein VFQ25_03475 [Ktedonobacterales bacterium]|nr:hypothetical protein [Ktedonobacterales bacterium]